MGGLLSLPPALSEPLCATFCERCWDSEMTKTPSQAPELKLQRGEPCGLPALSVHLAANLGSGLVHMPPALGRRQGHSPLWSNESVNQ